MVRWFDYILSIVVLSSMAGLAWFITQTLSPRTLLIFVFSLCGLALVYAVAHIISAMRGD
jgi:hypothetical protein